MKLSKLNIKKINLEDVNKDYSGQDILMKLGELYQFESGIYGYGNIFSKLEKNIENIIIDELDKADCIQVEFPKLQPRSIWDKSNRWDVFTKYSDTMFTLNNNLGEYGLSPTAEECAITFAQNRLLSYRQLPTIYYQIGEKFRKEIRTRGYLFRPRTFVMMDAYSFDTSKENMQKTFDKMHEVYMNIFNRIGINVTSVISDGGDMGGRISEEFQTITRFGEDIILYDEKSNIGINKEVLVFDDKDTFINSLNGVDINSMKECNSIELGNNFMLGTKYSDAMKLYYKDELGNDKPYYMGCFGIGLGRICALLIENNILIKDNKIHGFVLPYNVAPYKVQIIYKDDKKDIAFKLYEKLENNNIKAIIDDRDNYSLGSKIKDVYTLGTPYIIVIGDKFDGKMVEIENAKTNEKYEYDIDGICNFFKQMI